MDGVLKGVIDLFGVYICCFVVYGFNVYLAMIWLGDGSSGIGFVLILDEYNWLVFVFGGVVFVYEEDQFWLMYQVLCVFMYFYDVCVDEDENFYVVQWNVGFIYFIKFIWV